MINFQIFLFLFVFSFLSFNIFIVSFKTINKYLKLPKISNIQNIHKAQIPRIGGVICFVLFFFLFSVDFNFKYFEINLLIALSMLMIVGLKEDLYQNVKPNFRLVTLIFSSLCLVLILEDNLPLIKYPFLEYILLYDPLKILFYTFTLTALSNSYNIIDGINGNVAFSLLYPLLSCIFIDISINGQISNDVVACIIILISFLYFNFPKAQIFMGDLGAYFWGLILGFLIIKIFFIYDLEPLGAILILFYPIMEMNYTFIRRIVKKQNVLEPDLEHLHSLIYLYFVDKNANNPHIKTNLMLIPVSFIPQILFMLSNFNLVILLFSIIICIIIYICLYNYFKNKLYTKK